jgi:cytoskeletal protein CcmA (bactofilin family)
MSYRPTGAGTAYGENTAQSTEAYSLVDRHSNVEGIFTTDRDLRIEGVLRGTVKCQGLLYIAEGADIDATVEASSIAVAGQLRGTITCRGKLQLMPSGRVFATVMTESLVINEGAVLEGELRMESASATHGVISSTASDAADSGQSVLRRFGSDDEGSLPGQRTRQSSES